MGYFNSRPSARGDAMASRASRSTGVISIHAPPRGATRFFKSFPVSSKISIHAPPRGATSSGLAILCTMSISIHAPPRGATSCGIHGAFRCRFQFTPLREGRLSTDRNVANAVSDFNSRPSARGDYHLHLLAALQIISIHAPPRGATAKDMQFLQIFCSTLTNQHGLTIMPRNLSRLFW